MATHPKISKAKARLLMDHPFFATLLLTTLLLIVCFAALGAGNGALFQLVPLRWPMSTAVAGSMIGEIGALGGGVVPAMMGQAKQHMDSFLPGFVVMAVFSLLMLGVMRKMQVRWTRTWAEKGGRAECQRSGIEGSPRQPHGRHLQGFPQKKRRFHLKSLREPARVVSRRQRVSPSCSTSN